jgi:hypothetical protein
MIASGGNDNFDVISAKTISPIGLERLIAARILWEKSMSLSPAVVTTTVEQQLASGRQEGHRQKRQLQGHSRHAYFNPGS